MLNTVNYQFFACVHFYLRVLNMGVTICVKPTFVFCGEGSEFLRTGHMFLIFPYTFMRYFCILRRKEYEERTDKKNVSPVEKSDQRAGLFHKKPAQ